MASKTIVTLNGAALKSLAISSGQQDLRLRANRVLNSARRLVPVDTGRLRASLTVEYSQLADGSPVARVGSNLPYAIFVHEGTGLYGPLHHMIRPRNHRFMRWPVTNNSGAGRRRYKAGKTQAFIFAKQTRGHPGTPFLLQALDAAGGP